WFMLTQVETQIVSTLFWREWFPEIVYDIHQQGQFGSRKCVPPFFDPSNPNIDPTVLREVGALGSQMALNLQVAGFKGIVTNSTYDTWWHGGLRTAPYYHNAVGILTEAASVNIATPMQIKREQLRSPTRGLPDPLVAATNYPDPWPGGAWTMRDIMNMELVTTRTALEEAALHHDEYVRNFVNVAERAIEAGKRDAPYAYIVPAEQHDKPTANSMIDILIQQGVEVHRAKSDFAVDGKKYAAGSYVILLAQPYRANVKCLFEAQHYPDRRIYPGGPAEQPYDVAGWTLPMQMGVAYAEAGRRFDTELERIDSAGGNIRFIESAGSERAVGMAIYVRPDTDNVYSFINDLMKTSPGLSISRTTQGETVGKIGYPPGTFVIQFAPSSKPDKRREQARGAADMAKEKSLRELAVKYRVGYDLYYLVPKNVAEIFAKHNTSLFSNPPPKKSLSGTEVSTLIQPRLALYRSWMPSMDEGWTRWVLEQFGFDYKNVYDAEVRAGNLKDRFDVVIL
ncbi:MAG TPA: hypothetical protein VIS78_09555, partial [Blastocatellia bacterium]